MAVKPALLFTDNPGGLPAVQPFPPGFDAQIHRVFAKFNGAAASGAFYACLDVLSQDDKLIARHFPSDDVIVGDTAEVTYGPF